MFFIFAARLAKTGGALLRRTKFYAKTFYCVSVFVAKNIRNFKAKSDISGDFWDDFTLHKGGIYDRTGVLQSCNLNPFSFVCTRCNKSCTASHRNLSIAGFVSNFVFRDYFELSVRAHSGISLV